MEKIKYFIESDKGKDILTIIIVILVGLGSFGIGRLSKENSSSGIKITYPNQEATAIKAFDSVQSTTNTSQKGSKGYFASKRGNKYYPIDCSSGKTIKEENRVYFNSSIEAEKGGYQLSSSCN